MGRLGFIATFFVLSSATLVCSSPVNGDGRIANGVEAIPNQFPWMVYQENVFDDGNVTVCAGSLISDRCVLTVNGCLDREHTNNKTGSGKVSLFTRVYLGAHDMSNPNEPNRQVYQSSEYYFSDELTNGPGGGGGAGIIVLPERITFTDFIRPIALPSINETEPDHAGDPVTIAGWGHTYGYIEGVRSPVLRTVNTTVITNLECRRTFPLVDSKAMCTSGEGNVGFCYDDFGSPLMYFDPTKQEWKQVGISIFFANNGCDIGGASGYYRLRTPSVLQWIQNLCG